MDVTSLWQEVVARLQALPLPVAGGAAAVALLLGVLLLWLLRRRGAGRAHAGRAAPEEAPATWVSGLERTRRGLAQRLYESWRGPSEGDAWLDEVEEILLGSDVGVRATQALVGRLRRDLPQLQSRDELRDTLKRAVADILRDGRPPADSEAKPLVILVVGVNGVGKTTTIGKLAQHYREQGKSVLLVAGDTFRAAAVEQLVRWAERVGADCVKHQQGSDPAAVVFDGMKAALARSIDVVIVDTAGRLHVKANLMRELEKISRTLERQVPGAPHESFLVVDATTGQNALTQARVFQESIPLTGVILTKLDGTARGGIALSIRKELGLPIRWVGLGEKATDLAPFDAEEFVDALFTPAGDEP